MRKPKTQTATEEIALPFSGDEFADKWMEWLLYRKQRRLHNYVPVGLKKTFNRLVLDSGNDAKIAIAIIDQSLEKGWQGLFPLRTNNINNGATYKRTFEEKPTPNGNVATGGFGKL